jgi:branched-chain amino acid transport system permease protein
VLVVVSVVICHRLELSRVGRAWMAIREDEIAAKAMGINTRNMKLLAFGMGATFGGVSGAMFACLPGLHLARIVQPDGVGDDRRHGGAGRHGPPAGCHSGCGAAVGPARGAALCGRPLAGHDRRPPGCLHPAPVADCAGHDRRHALRPRGLWPSPEHGKSLQTAESCRRTT